MPDGRTLMENEPSLEQLYFSLNELLDRISAQERYFYGQINELKKREKELLDAWQRESQHVKHLREVISSTEVLYDVSSEQEISERAVEILQNLYPEAAVRFLYTSTNRAGMKLLAGRRLTPPLAEKCRISPLDCPVMKRGKPYLVLPGKKGVFCPEAASLPGVSGHGCLPLLAEGVAFGVLSLFFQGNQSYDDKDIEMLNIFSTHIGLAFTNARLIKIAVKEALTDQLTGLPNRRYALDVLQKEISRAERYGGIFCVAMVDLDNFKKVNDTFGHGEGDRVLVLFAGVAGRAFRKTDVVARFGGEEFLLILPQTNLIIAVKVVERFQALFNQATFSGALKAVNLTFSAGVAEYPADGRDVESLLNTADQRLYKAKDSGRNRVVGKES